MNYYKEAEQIGSLLNNFNSANAKAVKTILNADPDLIREFCIGVRSLDWFRWMKDSGYLEPSSIKFDDRGNVLFWDVLFCMEKISALENLEADVAKDLLRIIESLIKYSHEIRPINNFRIWWYCAMILNNIPQEIVKDNLTVERFRVWLVEWAKMSIGDGLPIGDICNKLLPKFLRNDATIKYAEIILDVITQIHPGGRRHAFANREEAKLAWDSYWILEAFQKNGQTIGQKCSVDVIFGLADKLKMALEYKQKNQAVTVAVEDDLYQIKVSRRSIEGAEMKFDEGKYDCIIRQFSAEQIKSTDPNKLPLLLYQTEPKVELKTFAFLAGDQGAFIEAIKSNLPTNIQWEKEGDLDKKIGGIFEALFSDYSYIGFKSLARDGNPNARDAEEVLIIALRDVLLAKCKVNQREGKLLLRAFLSTRFPFSIFRRLVLLCVDKYWDLYSIFLNKFFEVIPKALHESDYEVELYDVLKNHSSHFKNKFKQEIKSRIEDVPEYYTKISEKAVASWKHKWLSPLLDDPYFFGLYKENKQKAELPDAKPYKPEDSSFEGGFVTHKSPIAREEILQRSVAELVKYLSGFKGADSLNGVFEGKPDKEGLADALQEAVKDAPSKFTNEIDLLSRVPYFYLYRIFRGFGGAWESNNDLDWEVILQFCLTYLKKEKNVLLNEALQAQGKDSGGGKYIWMLEAIVELIGDGCRDDNHAFDPKHFDLVEQIFDALILHLNGDREPKIDRDALTYALNTTVGRTIMSYLTFSLRRIRVTKSPADDWGNKKYERFFGIGIEAYIWFGCDLPQVRHLDEKYAEAKIRDFLSISDFDWQMFMEGYLKGSKIYKDVYECMRLHYKKAIENKLYNESVDKRLVEHLAVGYLGGFECIGNVDSKGRVSLFRKMLDEALVPEKRDRWIEIASFFWRISSRNAETPSEGKRGKIIAFWRWSFENQKFIEEKLGDQIGTFWERMGELTLLLERIDEEKERWLLLSAGYYNEESRPGFFIEYLTRFLDDDDSVGRLGRIYLRILKKQTPFFREEHIKSIVEALYKLWAKDKSKWPRIKEQADEICNTYGRRGVHFLRELYFEYNKG